MKKETEVVKISALVPDSKNANRHTERGTGMVGNSLQKYGAGRSILLDKNNRIIAGNLTTEQAAAMGMNNVRVIDSDGTELIAVRRTDLDIEKDVTARELGIADNRTAEVSLSWNPEVLQELNLDGVDLSNFFYEKELVSLGFGKTDLIDEEPPEVPVTPRTQIGDVYTLGDHVLLCDDSLNEKTVAKFLKNKPTIDLVLTDPPYDFETEGGGILKESKAMKEIKKHGLNKFTPDKLKRYAETSVIFCNKSLVKQYIELAEKWFCAFDLCFYKKENTVPNYGGHLMTDVEYIFVIGKQDPNPGLDKQTYSKAYIGNKDLDNEIAWSKPVELCAKWILLYSEKTVLDLFAGTGSTLIAAEQLNRICFAMENDPKFCDVIVERYLKITGDKTVLLNGKKIIW